MEERVDDGLFSHAYYKQNSGKDKISKKIGSFGLLRLVEELPIVETIVDVDFVSLVDLFGGSDEHLPLGVHC